MGRESYDLETGLWMPSEAYQELRHKRANAKHGSKRSALPSPYVMGDTKEYWSPLSGQMVSSRATRREEMKRHDVVEIGNEPLSLKKRTPKRSPIGPTLKRVYERLEARDGRKRKA